MRHIYKNDKGRVVILDAGAKAEKKVSEKYELVGVLLDNITMVDIFKGINLQVKDAIETGARI